jgi:hypothetical protein
MRSKVPDPGLALGKKLVDANALTEQAGDLVCTRSTTLIAASTWAQGLRCWETPRQPGSCVGGGSVGSISGQVAYWSVVLGPGDRPPRHTSTRYDIKPRSELQTATTLTPPPGAVSTTGMVTVRGRHRRSADVVAELMDVLADEPRVVACDLAGMTAEGSAMLAKGFAPVGECLTHWPGTVVMVYAPDPQLRSRLHDAKSGARLLIHISRGAAGTEPMRLLQTLARGWGVIPARSAGSTLWIVLDAATGQRHPRHAHRQQAGAAHDAPSRWERRNDGSLF